MDKIEEARKILKEAGFFVNNLWHLDDIREFFKEGFSEEVGQRILNLSLTNEATMEQIKYSIKTFGEGEGLTPIKDEE